MNESVALYHAFSEFQPPRTIRGCECCISEKQLKVLATKRLVDITPDEIATYAGSALKTVGSIDGFMYLFPRVFDLLMKDALEWVDPEIVYGAMVEANFSQWDKRKKDLIQGLSRKKYVNVLKGGDTIWGIDVWLCAISHIENDLSFYLQQLEQPEHAQALYSFIERNMQSIFSGKLQNAFWRDCPDQEKIILSWMRQGKVAEYFLKAYGMDLKKRATS
ncbi:hypothetical protein [Microbulbifer spongiae]|uniref:Uncharacterized protein n=1 Tax=Microbulbifer spongiae TaxID=2944933 RepID=A0ABY9EAK8_9GAMM|nr:hypothetical protein [Microbulbifer sp. MI-G]WKD48931.1 hypothetical protein M8T91_13645 [Microbulbifer sp. MI-G]